MIRRILPKKERELILLTDFISNSSLGLRVKKIVESETPDFIVNIDKNLKARNFPAFDQIVSITKNYSILKIAEMENFL